MATCTIKSSTTPSKLGSGVEGLSLKKPDLGYLEVAQEDMVDEIIGLQPTERTRKRVSSFFNRAAATATSTASKPSQLHLRATAAACSSTSKISTKFPLSLDAFLSRIDIQETKRALGKFLTFRRCVNVFGLGGVVLYLIVHIVVTHPYLVLFGLSLIVYSVLSAIIPSGPRWHRGVDLFGTYDLPVEDMKKMDVYKARAAEKRAKMGVQPLWDPEDYEKEVFIISVDGGGMKGILSARILERIHLEFPDFQDRVDLLSGCSTGGIIAGLSASGYDFTDIVDMFRIMGPKVFRISVMQLITGLGGFFLPTHDGVGKLECFQYAWDDLSLRELARGVCITGSELCPTSKQHPCVPKVWSNIVDLGAHTFSGHEKDEFGNLEGPPISPASSVSMDDQLDGEEQDNDQSHGNLEEGDRRSFFGSSLQNLVADVVNSATAAPGFFPTHQSHADGGIWANNPSAACLATILPYRSPRKISMISISTGTSEKPGCLGGYWGLAHWLGSLPIFMINSTSEAIHSKCAAILQERYHRIDPTLPEMIGLNDVSSTDRLIEIADNFDMTETFRFLESRGFKRIKI